MSLKSPTQNLFNQDGYAVAAKEGSALSETSAALLLAGSDGTDTHYISLDTSGRNLIAGAGIAGTPEGGVLSLQGVAGGQDLPISISNFPVDQSIVQDNASELLASVGGLGASGSATVGNPVSLGLSTYEGDTINLLSDSSGRLAISGFMPSTGPLSGGGGPDAGAPMRVGASDGTNAIDILSDSSGRLIMVGAADDGAAVAGAPILIAGSDLSDTQTLLTDSDGRLIAAGAAADGAAVAGSPVRLGASDGSITRNILSDDQGRLIRVGAAAAGSAPSGNPVLAGGTDGTNVQIFKLDTNGSLQVSQVKVSEATLYETAATTTSSELLASNTAREGAIVFNDSNKFLYVKLGASASTTEFTTRIAPGGNYIVPAGFTGEISGLWNDATASGTARVTELAPGGGGGILKFGYGGYLDDNLTNYNPNVYLGLTAANALPFEIQQLDAPYDILDWTMDSTSPDKSWIITACNSSLEPIAHVIGGTSVGGSPLPIDFSTLNWQINQGITYETVANNYAVQYYRATFSGVNLLLELRTAYVPEITVNTGSGPVEWHTVANGSSSGFALDYIEGSSMIIAAADGSTPEYVIEEWGGSGIFATGNLPLNINTLSGLNPSASGYGEPYPDYYISVNAQYIPINVIAAE